MLGKEVIPFSTERRVLVGVVTGPCRMAGFFAAFCSPVICEPVGGSDISTSLRFIDEVFCGGAASGTGSVLYVHSDDRFKHAEHGFWPLHYHRLLVLGFEAGKIPHLLAECRATAAYKG